MGAKTLMLNHYMASTCNAADCNADDIQSLSSIGSYRRLSRYQKDIRLFTSLQHWILPLNLP